MSSTSKEPTYLKVARSEFWNYWHSLTANERRLLNSASMLKGWMARAEVQHKETTK